MKFPNLLFVGAEKAGSTTIHRVLSEHKDIFVIRKETEFFSFCNKKKKKRLLFKFITRVLTII